MTGPKTGGRSSRLHTRTVSIYRTIVLLLATASLAGLTILGCASSSGNLTTSATSLNFGNVAIGSSRNQSLTLTNSGTADSTITQITPTGGGFRIKGPSLPLTLVPGQSATFTTSFAPTAMGSVSGSLSITIATTQVETITMTGAGVPVAPSITAQPASQTVAVGQTATFSVTGSGADPLSYQWRKTGTAISGAISPSYTTPSEPTSDAGAQFTVVVSNSSGSVTSNAATLTVTPAPGTPLQITTSPLPNAQAGIQFQASLTATGGVLPYRWSVASGTLPSGLSLNTDTGVLSGTTLRGGPFDFGVQVSDSSSPKPQTAMKALTLSVLAFALRISSTGLPNGQVGVSFQASLSASGGVTPYTWAVTGALPVGLVLNASSGAINGTPTQAGTSAFTIQLKDAAQQTAQMLLSITIAPASAQPLSISTTDLAQPAVGQAYSATLNAVGGGPPYKWSVTSGKLPAGLNLNDSTGAITGMPTSSGQYSFTVQVRDSAASPQTVSKQFGIALSVSAAGKVPDSFFGLTVFGTPTCANNTCNPATSFPLNGGILPGTLGKVGFIGGYHAEPSCDGGTDPNNSCYQWGNFDLWVNFAQTYGYMLVYDWDLPPGWQCGQASNTSCAWLPSNISYMSHFATALATRYAGKIQYYETGNEVDATGNWTGTCADLVLLHNTIHDAIKAADPSAIVGAPNMTGYSSIGTACDSSPVYAGTDSGLWIQNFLQTQDKNGFLPRVDTVGLHTYQVVQPALRNVAQRFLDEYNQFRSIMTAAGIPKSAPLLVTEGSFGPDSNSNCTAPLSSTACLTAAEQIAYIGRWLALGASIWADGGGQLPSWYAYDADWGALNATAGMNPQNALAYGHMETWIKGATFQQQCHTGSPSTVFVCDFTTGGGQQAEIVFNDNNGASASYTTPAWATTYQALLGSAQAISGGSVTVGDTPILLK